MIDSRGEPLAGVTVRNCSFRRFARHGVLIHWGLANDRKLARYPEREERWRRAPQDILLENLRVEQNAVMGIVIDDYVQRVTMARVSVIDNPGWGLYWDHDSRGHLLIHSEVCRNGHGSAFGKPGLSIDASSDNRVIDTAFEDNGRSAIELYRNCWEFAATNPRSVPREEGANRNQILGNRFIDEKVGVWIASRQSQDVSRMQCGRPAYHEGRYVEDEARDNVVARNRFERLRGRGIVVEDDANSVIGNRFEHGEGAISVGTPIRARVLHRPVVGTLLRDNQADDGVDPQPGPQD
ncbi:right-handed parallel beta-helix repeat-containing protein [Candidatus Dactylopiibacterium carminicum]|uniref:right-handed parallel beta-helix repeat-containing protein n=1 Tax=Candidatus Dactylopiibacterium carminicum TaxID=857335 RepID=UPI001140D35F|nr:right-handed parallel beta-helix repeat-containing protein [Candidatus Dactylopiibacterium carminicum]